MSCTTQKPWQGETQGWTTGMLPHEVLAQALQAHGLPIITDPVFVLPRAQKPDLAGLDPLQKFLPNCIIPGLPERGSFSPAKLSPDLCPVSEAEELLKPMFNTKAGTSGWKLTIQSTQFHFAEGCFQPLMGRSKSSQSGFFQLKVSCTILAYYFKAISLWDSLHTQAIQPGARNQNEHSRSISEYNLLQLVNEAQNADKGRKGNAK